MGGRVVIRWDEIVAVGGGIERIQMGRGLVLAPMLMLMLALMLTLALVREYGFQLGREAVRVEVWVVMLVALIESWEWERVSLAQAEAVRARPRTSVGRVNLIVVAGVGLRGMRID